MVHRGKGRCDLKEHHVITDLSGTMFIVCLVFWKKPYLSPQKRWRSNVVSWWQVRVWFAHDAGCACVGWAADCGGVVVERVHRTFAKGKTWTIGKGFAWGEAKMSSNVLVCGFCKKEFPIDEKVSVIMDHLVSRHSPRSCSTLAQFYFMTWLCKVSSERRKVTKRKVTKWQRNQRLNSTKISCCTFSFLL